MLITSSESLSYTLDLSEKVLGESFKNLKKSLDPARYCTTFMPGSAKWTKPSDFMDILA